MGILVKMMMKNFRFDGIKKFFGKESSRGNSPEPCSDDGDDSAAAQNRKSAAPK